LGVQSFDYLSFCVNVAVGVGRRTARQSSQPSYIPPNKRRAGGHKYLETRRNQQQRTGSGFNAGTLTKNFPICCRLFPRPSAGGRFWFSSLPPGKSSLEKPSALFHPLHAYIRGCTTENRRPAAERGLRCKRSEKDRVARPPGIGGPLAVVAGGCSLGTTTVDLAPHGRHSYTDTHTHTHARTRRSPRGVPPPWPPSAQAAGASPETRPRRPGRWPRTASGSLLARFGVILFCWCECSCTCGRATMGSNIMDEESEKARGRRGMGHRMVGSQRFEWMRSKRFCW